MTTFDINQLSLSAKRALLTELKLAKLQAKLG